VCALLQGSVQQYAARYAVATATPLQQRDRTAERGHDAAAAANTIEEMQKLLLGYRDNMKVEVETGVAVAASTVADLRALATWPDGLALNIHSDIAAQIS
jgi:hypothetical protein